MKTQKELNSIPKIHVSARKVIHLTKATDMVASMIRQDILNGTLKPGDKLASQIELTKEFGVSRPTLREALRILEADRLITTIRGSHGGAVVNAPDPDLIQQHMLMVWRSQNTTIDDLFEVRKLIEPAVVYELALRSSPEIVNQLTACLEKERTSTGNSVEFSHAIASFHRALITLFGNHPLNHLMESINSLLERYLPIGLDYARAHTPEKLILKNFEISLSTKKQLIEYIKDAKAVEAMELWKTHMKNSHKNWIESNVGLTIQTLING